MGIGALRISGVEKNDEEKFGLGSGTSVVYGEFRDRKAKFAKMRFLSHSVQEIIEDHY
jgi:hypothetical protein